MTNFQKRVITCVIGLPLVFFALVVPLYSHIIFAAFVCVIATLGSWEVQKLARLKIAPRFQMPFCFAGFIPAGTWITFHYGLDFPLEGALISFLACISLATEPFFGYYDKDEFRFSFGRVMTSLGVLIYPAYLCTFLIKLMFLGESGPYNIGYLIALVFANDIFCYVCGMLFGKSSRGIVKVSPKKSLAGFIGGAVFAVLISFCYCAYIPAMQWVGTPRSLLIGLFIALSADIGDLAESAIKRSAGVKDSGSIIPGRGGVLDSFDSTLFSAAPLYYFLLIAEHQIAR